MRDDDSSPRRPRFSLDINLGHLLIAATMVGSVLLAYSDLRSTVAVHENRLTTLEHSERDFFKEIRDKLDGIIATLASKQDRPR